MAGGYLCSEDVRGPMALWQGQLRLHPSLGNRGKSQAHKL